MCLDGLPFPQSFARSACLPWRCRLPVAAAARRRGRQYQVHGKVLTHGRQTGRRGDRGVAPGEPGGRAPLPAAGNRRPGRRLRHRFPPVQRRRPEGDYDVTLIWPEEQDPKNPSENTPPDRLKDRYDDVKHAKWHVHVKAGDNVLEPFTVE